MPAPDAAAAPGPVPVGAVKRYPVTQANGATANQLILVTGVDEDGAVRGFPLGYEDQAARIAPGDFLN